MKEWIPNKFKERRKSLGFSQYQVAEILGIKQSTLSSYENGRREPNVSEWFKWANILGIEVILL